MTLVIGVGNPWRGDDGAGPAVARLAGGRVHEGDGAGLLDLWSGADDVAVIDASRSGAPPGATRRFDARAAPLPARELRSSTHGFGVAGAVELARELDRLPARLTVYAVEGADFAPGETLSPAVADAVRRLAGNLRNGA